MLEGRLHPSNLELNVAGDFDEAELEELVLNYMGEWCGDCGLGVMEWCVVCVSGVRLCVWC